MQTATGGVKTIKIYGKQGRRIRAKERLEAKFNRINTSFGVHMKIKSKDRPHSEEYYSIIKNDLARMSKELETLKSHI